MEPEDPKKHRLETRVVHAGDPRPRIEGAAVIPIFQSTVFQVAVWGHPEEARTYEEVRYPRLTNLPNQMALGRKLAALEGAEAAIVAGSGMAAISTAILAILGKGGHLLVQEHLYGGTHTLVVGQLEAFGARFDFIDSTDPRAWKEKLRPETRAIYVETMANPLLQVADHRAVVAFAREHGIVSMVDNTFATPVNFRPPELGYDLSLHSATKYLNGHSDLVAGAVIGRGDLVRRVHHLLNHLGGTLDPHACFLLNRGLKTLVLRVRRQNESALAVARFLASRPEVARVNYPGLESHPHHARARALFAGFGGMLSFELAGGEEAAKRLLERLELPIHGPSLGGVETLITRPVTTSHAGLTPEERRRLGISAGLLRVSVGIEAVEDIIEDFERALAALRRESFSS
jgi:cystathionine beta-lyase/cystathionine gamma-synthase